MSINKIVLPDFYYSMREDLKAEYLAHSQAHVVDWWNNLSPSEKRAIHYHRMCTIFRYTVLKSKNFLKKYMNSFKHYKCQIDEYEVR